MAVFISYAKEDAVFAQELFLALENVGLEPWMDKPPAPYQPRGLMPGENWRHRLQQEIRNAERVILLLSPVSIAKVGYVQNEFRLALQVMNSMPPNAHFVVPLLIDNCEPPELVVGTIALSDLQWTILSEVGIAGFVALLMADLAP